MVERCVKISSVNILLSELLKRQEVKGRYGEKRKETEIKKKKVLLRLLKFKPKLKYFLLPNAMMMQ